MFENSTSRSYVEENYGNNLLGILSPGANPQLFHACFNLGNIGKAWEARNLLNRARAKGAVDFESAEVVEVPAERCPLLALPKGTMAVLTVRPRRWAPMQLIEEYFEKNFPSVGCTWAESDDGIFCTANIESPRALAEDARAKGFTVTFNKEKGEVYFWVVLSDEKEESSL